MPDVLFHKEGPLAILTFNRPEARNAMTFAMYEFLAQQCDVVDSDPEIRVFILRGAGGKAFASGTDISQFRAFQGPEDALRYEETINRIVGRLEAVQKPVIAQIEGVCVGGGFGMAMACDLRYCTPESRFGLPIARTLGNCLSMQNYARLVDLVGAARAKELLFTARLVEGPEALELGIVNAVLPAGELETRVRELALQIAANAPLTVRASKEAIGRISRARRQTGGDDRDIVLSCYLSEDFKEGVSAFLEKRTPVWRGR